MTNPNQGYDAAVNQDRLGYEGKASYTWAGDVSGKVWAGFASYDVTAANSSSVTGASGKSWTATAYELGANANTGNLGVTAYYYKGTGVGTTLFGNLGVDSNGKKRDSNGGYLQATYVIPTGTKLGVSYGVSRLDDTAADRAATGTELIETNRRWTVGAYHPLTKSLNLVAEYNDVRSELQNYNTDSDAKSKNVSLGAILFF